MKSPKFWVDLDKLSKQYNERTVNFSLTLFDYFSFELSLYLLRVRIGVDYKRLFV